MNSSERLDSALRKISRFSGVRDEKVRAKIKCIEELSKANGYLAIKDEVNSVLEKLQAKAQESSKGFFERLLTTLIRDIMPASEDQVVFDLETKNNRSALSVCVENLAEAEFVGQTPHLEDVFEDKGGSITNIISMGLRFIVLSRTQNRKFLIFDEADCWLKPDLIPAFAKVLTQLSKELGVQVLYITHHDESNFTDIARIVKLSKDDGVINADTLSEGPNDGYGSGDLVKDDYSSQAFSEGMSLRYVRLVNIKSHEDTLIELSPNVTVIVGDNDVGKSNIVAALESVFYNSGRPGLIKRYQPNSKVEIGLEDDMTLTWQYRRKGAHKTRYELTDIDGNIINESNDGRNTPSWLNDYLSVPLIDGRDIHINSQKDPVFMLGKDISPAQRAKLLSLGKESDYIQRMIKVHNEQLTKSRSQKRKSESEIRELETSIDVLRKLNEMEADAEQIVETKKSIETELQKYSGLQNEVESISSLTNTVDSVNRYLSILNDLPTSPTIVDLRELENIVFGLKDAFEISTRLSQLNEIENVEIPVISELDELLRMGMEIGNLQSRIDTLDKGYEVVVPPSISEEVVELKQLIDQIESVTSIMEKEVPVASTIPEILSTDILVRDASEIREFTEIVNNLNSQLEQTGEDLLSTQREIDEFKKEFGTNCPECGQSISHQHEHMKEAV